MAKIEWIHHRLERWAMWMARGRVGSGGASHPMWGCGHVDGGEVHEVQIPIDEVECSKTHDAIQSLPPTLAETVACYYLQDSDRTRRRLRITSSVLSQRIDRAHGLLSLALTKAPSALEQQMPRGWLDRGSFPP